MNFGDLKECFEMFFLCPVKQANVLSGIYCERFEYNTCTFEVTTPGEYFFFTHQKDVHCFPKACEYGYSTARLFVVKVDGDEPYDNDGTADITYMIGTFGETIRDAATRACDLTEGRYVAYSKVHWRGEIYENLRQYHFCSYGPAELTFEKNESIDEIKLLKKAITSAFDQQLFPTKKFEYTEDYI